MVNGVVGWMFGSGAGDPGDGWIMVQLPWKVRCDGKNIFGLDGHEVWAAGEDTGSCTLCVIGEVLCESMRGRV